MQPKISTYMNNTEIWIIDQNIDHHFLVSYQDINFIYRKRKPKINKLQFKQTATYWIMRFWLPKEAQSIRMKVKLVKLAYLGDMVFGTTWQWKRDEAF